MGPSSSITLTTDVVFTPECTGDVDDASLATAQAVTNNRDPFSASESPQIYTLAATTVVAYTLVIMLFITPRTFFLGGAGGGSFLGGRGLLGGSYGSTVLGIGGRPWLQKVAALTVAISLTIASADTFKVAEAQYDMGYVDATSLTSAVVGGTELCVIRVISTTFLWLAQVQTLVRLFPRHKEKVIIKWAGFALIVLDVIFASLDNFVADTKTSSQPRSFVDAIPALSYLFELSLNLLYAAWVIYYSFCKRRYAFFHAKMQNIFLIAMLSLAAVLIPVVFFVLDISKPNAAGWGDYVRWVGSAAGSVIVWEWVERIETLERDERKDGILGREVFDGEEMLEIGQLEEIDWPNHPHHRPPGDFQSFGQRPDDRNRARNSQSHGGLPRYRISQPQGSYRARDQQQLQVSFDGLMPNSQQPTRPSAIHPPQTASPVSRTDTQSAESTIYNVRYHPVVEPSPSVPEGTSLENTIRVDDPNIHRAVDPPLNTTSIQPEGPSNVEVSGEASSSQERAKKARWNAVPNPFKRRRMSPPPEVATVQEGGENRERAVRDRNSRWNLRSKLNTLASDRRPHWRRKSEDTSVNVPLPITVIPAQPRGRTWSPSDGPLSATQAGESQNPAIESGASRPPVDEDQQAGESQVGPSTPGPLLRSHSSGMPQSLEDSPHMSRRGTLRISEPPSRRRLTMENEVIPDQQTSNSWNIPHTSSSIHGESGGLQQPTVDEVVTANSASSEPNDDPSGENAHLSDHNMVDNSTIPQNGSNYNSSQDIVESSGTDHRR
ncbi:MAG: pH-response regulator protein palH/rim21 [Cirrosporium novae-zelandiae]|nr:MAG: pH-response regulator protein palH/rim21 [Cirrosporium novae-zelandiae]